MRPHQPNPNYVGRVDVREKLQQVLVRKDADVHGQRTYALCGLGGVGKTQAALDFVFEYMNDFQAVLWASADTRGKLLESFAGFAVEMGLINEGDSNRTGRDVLKKWFDEACMPVLVPDWLMLTLLHRSRALASHI